MIVNEYPESAQLAGPILHFAFRGTDGRHGHAASIGGLAACPVRWPVACGALRCAALR
jgi:hypothetical protein